MLSLYIFDTTCVFAPFYPGQIAGIVIGVLAAVAIIGTVIAVLGVAFYKERTGVCKYALCKSKITMCVFLCKSQTLTARDSIAIDKVVCIRPHVIFVFLVLQVRPGHQVFYLINQSGKKMVCKIHYGGCSVDTRLQNADHLCI